MLELIVRRFLQTKRGPAPAGLLGRHQGWPGHTGAIKPSPRVRDSQGIDRARGGIGRDPRASDCGGGRLLGRKALIAGGDSDWSRAVAIAFSIEGADVALCCPPPQGSSVGEESSVDEMGRWMHRAGHKPVPLPGDLSTEDACAQRVAASVRALGSLDILVIDASRPRSVARPRSVGDIAHMSTEQFDATFSRNIYTMFWLTKAALPHLGPGSSIINTGPPTGADAADIELDYSATKGAIMVFTRSLAGQLAGRGIRVNAVAPEPIWTPRTVAGESAAGERRGRQQALISTYVWLASTHSCYATGQLYGAVDAGDPAGDLAGDRKEG